MALEQDEAHELALALAEVERYYPINPLSPKHMAVVGLVLTVSKTYGKRVPLILHPKPRREASPSPGPGGGPRPVSAAPVTNGAADAWYDAPQAPMDHVQ